MKVKVEFDVSETDPIKVLKDMVHHFTDGEILNLIEDILDGRAWGAKVEVFEHENPVDHWEMNLDEPVENIDPIDYEDMQYPTAIDFDGEPNDSLLAQQELEDYEGLSGFDNPDIERL